MYICIFVPSYKILIVIDFSYSLSVPEKGYEKYILFLCVNSERKGHYHMFH